MKNPNPTLSGRKKRYAFAFILLFLITRAGLAQQTVSIGSTQVKSNAVLFLSSAGKNQGLIIPIVSSRNSISGSGAEAGMIVFDDSDKKVYYHNGTDWVETGGTGSGGTPVALTPGQNITITGAFPNFTISAPNVDAVVGNEVTQVNATRGGLEISGAGTAASPLSVGLVQGTVDGQILKWDNTNKRWVLGTDNAGGSPAVDNVTIEDVSGLRVKDAGISAAKIANDAVTRDKINADVAGTGLVQVANGSLNVDVGNTAGKIVQLDGSGKLPAVDGSQLTNLPGGTLVVDNVTIENVSGLRVKDAGVSVNKIANDAVTRDKINADVAGTGLVQVANGSLTVDVGTTAGKIVQLDGTGKLPAIDGSQLTNLPGGGDITSVAAGTGLTGGGTTGAVTISMPNSGVTAGAYGSTTLIPQITVDAQGRITAVTTATIPDASATNEIQNLTFSGTGSVATGESFSLNISSGTPVTIKEGTNISIDQATNVLTINAAAGGATALDGLSDATVASPTTGQILVNDGAGQFRNVSMSSDASITATGVLTLSAGSVSGGAGGDIVDASITFNDLAPSSVSGGAGGILTDASIVDADVNTTAAIQGTKISPNFGAQVVQGTGNILSGDLTGARFTVSGAPVTYGIVGVGTSTGATSYGVMGVSQGAVAAGPSYGVFGRSTATSANNYGVWGEATGAGTTNFGVYGSASNATNNWAGFFNGSTAIVGAIALGATQDQGTAGWVLTSNGPGIAPSWSDVSGGGGGFSTANVIPKGNGVGLVSSSLTDNGTTLSTTLDFNLATGKALMINNARVLHNTGTNNIFLGANTGNVNTAINNSFVGAGAGQANTSGAENAFFGRNAGNVNTTGSFNVYLGKDAGSSMITGGLNTFVGFAAGGNTATGVDAGTFVGANAGEITTGDFNTFVGESAGVINSSGNSNVFVGQNTGILNTSGSNNTLIGKGANVAAGNYSNATAIGSNAIAGASNTVILGDGNANVGIGTSTPRDAVEIQGGNLLLSGNAALPNDPVDIDFKTFANVFKAKIWTAPTTNTLWFSTSTTPTTAKHLTIDPNGWIGVGRTPTTNIFEVEGEASKAIAGNWIANSDARIKTDIRDIPNGIETVKRLHPVMFRYTDYWRNRNPSIKDKFYYNFIAQEFRQVFPDAVKGSGEFIEGDGQEILQVDTYNAQIVTLKAVQELIEKVERLEKENQQLKQENTALETELRAELTKIKETLGMEAKRTGK